MNKMKFNLSAVFVCALFSCVGCGQDDVARHKQSMALLESLRQGVDLNGATTPDVVAGQQMPKTVGADIDGQKIDLLDHQGKVILLSFWGGG